MSHSQATKDFLGELGWKLRILQWEAEEYYHALQHPLNEKDDLEWDRVIGAIMGAAHQAQQPDFIDPNAPDYASDPEPADPFETFYGRPRLTLVERHERVHIPDRDFT